MIKTIKTLKKQLFYVVLSGIIIFSWNKCEIFFKIVQKNEKRYSMFEKSVIMDIWKQQQR